MSKSLEFCKVRASNPNISCWSDRKYDKNILSNNRKLTREDVEYIKKDKEHTYKELADQFKVSKTTISNVKNNHLYV